MVFTLYGCKDVFEFLQFKLLLRKVYFLNAGLEDMLVAPQPVRVCVYIFLNTFPALVLITN